MKKKINTSGGEALGQSSFANLDQLFSDPLPAGPTGEPSPSAPVSPAKVPSATGIIRLRREKKGHGGKTVTVLSPDPLLTPEQTESVLRQLKKDLGTGGRADKAELFLQGEPSERLRESLTALGFRVKG